MKNIWVIQVTFYNQSTKTVNTNEGYLTYEKAKAAVLKKIEIGNLLANSDYNFYDIENEIGYELKLVDIYE